MIKSLTNLEIVEVGSNARPLLKKKGATTHTVIQGVSGDTDGKNVKIISTGRAGFIEEKEFCFECKKYMTHAKNQCGTAYLRCSNKNCKHTRYLEKDTINWYIRVKNVCCPKD